MVLKGRSMRKVEDRCLLLQVWTEGHQNQLLQGACKKCRFNWSRCASKQGDWSKYPLKSNTELASLFPNLVLHGCPSKSNPKTLRMFYVPARGRITCTQESGVPDSCGLPCGCRELNLGPLEVHSVLLTTEPSPQACFGHFLTGLFWVTIIAVLGSMASSVIDKSSFQGFCLLGVNCLQIEDVWRNYIEYI